MYSHRVAKICTEERNIENILARTNFNKIGSNEEEKLVEKLKLKELRSKESLAYFSNKYSAFFTCIPKSKLNETHKINF